MAVIHDVLMTIGIYFLANKQLSGPMVAAVLTIIGFTAVYGVLAVIECRLMLQAIQKGPDAVSEMGSFG